MILDGPRERESMLNDIMKKTAAVLLAAGALWVSGAPARAESSAEANPSILAVNNGLSLSHVASRLYYIEPDDGQFNTGYFDFEKGGLKGTRGAVSFMGKSHLYAQASYDVTGGRVAYQGFFGVTPERLTSLETMRDLGFKFGIGLVGGKDWMLTPYVTAGWRRWVRVVGADTPGVFSERYDFTTIGLGNMIQYAPWDGWVLTGNASFGKTLHPSIDVPSVGLDRSPLGSAPVIRLSAEADCRVYKWIHVFLGAEYIHYAFNQSDVQPTGFIEPFSTTDIHGYTAGVRVGY